MRINGVLLAASAVLLVACGSCSSSSANGKGSSSSSGGGSGGGSGGSSGGSSGSGGGVTPAMACSDYATEVCAQLNTCTPFGLTVAYGTMQTCVERVTLTCTPMFGAGGSTLTGDQLESCVTAMKAETCDEWEDNAQPSACNLTGTLAAGAACGLGAQCQSGYCRLAPLSACGTCAGRANSGPGPDGGPTCASDADCAAMLVCSGGTCVSPAAKGAACSMTQPCLRTLSCIGGSCATPLAVGAMCTNLTDCAGATGAICNTAATPKACIQTASAMTGQACGIVSGGLTVCTGGATCANVTMGQGTCHQPAADNTVCGPDLGCLAPATCTSSARCTLPTSGCH